MNTIFMRGEEKSDELLFFLFANKGKYLTDSLIRLNLRNYVQLHLKQSGYQSVYYISSYDDEVEVKAIDDNSIVAFPFEKWGFLKSYNNKSSKTNGEVTWTFSKDRFWRMLMD